jgi:hypothetical protein
LKRFAYDLGGFEVRSAFPLPGLRPVSRSEPAATILVDASSGAVPEAGPVVFQWPGRYGLTLRAFGDGWLVSSINHGAAVVSADGRSIHCYPDTASSSDWPDVLVRRILPRLVQWHGRIALHAATLSNGRTATLLLGPSGAGKSTLAAALRRDCRWRVLSDDISLIDGDANPPVGLPTGAGLCLWSDSLSAFVPSVSACRIVAGHKDKRWLEEDADMPASPGPVGSIVVLTGRDLGEISLCRVPPKDAAMHAGSQMLCFNPSDPALFARSWAAIGRLVDAVPVFSFSYPRGYAHLADVATRLSTLLGDHLLVTA